MDDLQIKYLPRISDIQLELKIRSAGAVLIEGAKWCGKTTSAKQYANSVIYMQDPSRQEQYRQMISINPVNLLAGDTPKLVDEWQLFPQLWDTVRFAVDQRQKFGQFILTGSSIPADQSQIKHTGTGRITRLSMRTMSLYESGDSNGSVSLGEIFRQGGCVDGTSDMTLERLAFLTCRGGWPRAIGAPADVALMQANLYFEAVVESDILRIDERRRDPEKMRKFLRSYARAVGSQMSANEILKDLQANNGSISLTTIYDYAQVLKKLFVIEESPAWNPNLRSKSSIRSTDTRYFMDPSIASAALAVGPQDLINDLKTFGLFFENLCVRDLRIYAQALNGDVYHYRDSLGLECDAVVHLRNGKYGLIEIKLGGDYLIEHGAQTLLKLESKLNTQKMPAPSFKMVLVGVGDFAYMRRDGVMVVPIGCLKN